MSAVQQYILSSSSRPAHAHSIATETARCTQSFCLSILRKYLLVTALESKETTLIDVVQSLGNYINDEDATNRAKAMDYLVQVTAALNPTYLSKQQTQVLCQFFCDRIEDAGAPEGLKHLQTMSRHNNEMALMTFRA